MESADLSKRLTRKWPGLGANVFNVDYGALFPEFGEFKNEAENTEEPVQTQPPAKGGKGEAAPVEKDDSKDNEIINEIEVQNTN